MNRNGNNREWRRGFSLMELLVVIGVIALLVGILIPSLNYLNKRAKTAASQALVNSLAQALESYKSDCGTYPPSANDQNVSGPYQQISGAGGSFLAEGLMGWMGYSTSPNLGDGAGPTNGDGQFGFRLTPGGRGRVYGPYMTAKPDTYGMENASSKQLPNSQWVFLDNGNPILYYRAAPVSDTRWGGPRQVKQVFATSPTNQAVSQSFLGVFVTGDNVVSGGRTPDMMNDAQAIAFRRKLGNLDGSNTIKPGDVIVGRDSFLLVSPGVDGTYFTEDDVVNLQQ